MTAGYYQKNKERLQKDADKSHQNLSKEEKNKKRKKARKRYQKYF